MISKIAPPGTDTSGKFIGLGNDRYAIVDADDFERLSKYKWYARSTRYNTYAYRKVESKNSTFLVWMHREINHTINGMCCHHINHIGLDNRKENLLNMTDHQHYELHRFP